MKLLLVPALVLAFWSCNQEGSKPAARPRIVASDSPLTRSAAIINPYVSVDVSPMDISYFPVDFPVEHMYGRTGAQPLARVIYSRPQREGRKVFGGLLKYGEIWRLGANEATEIEFFRPVEIEGKKLPQGRYTMYVIPFEGRWTVVFNSTLFVWGLTPDPSKDVLKVDIPATETGQPVEYFSMVFEKTENGANLVMAWDEVVAKLPIVIR